MPPEEREIVLNTWNETRAEFPGDATLHELIQAQAVRTPTRTAVVAEAGVTRELTYAELDRRADALAARLQALGVERDTPVAVIMERSAELVVALLAVLKSGGAYVPVDPGYPAARQRLLVADCGAQVILTQRALAEALPNGPSAIAVDA